MKNDSDESLLRRCLHSWKLCLDQHHDDLGRADLVHSFKSLQSAFHEWRQVTIRANDNIVKADGAAAFFAQRTAMRVWKSSMARKRQDNAVKARQLAELKDAFTRTSRRHLEVEVKLIIRPGWKWETERAIETRDAIVRFQTNRDLVSSSMQAALRSELMRFSGPKRQYCGDGRNGWSPSKSETWMSKNSAIGASFLVQ